MNTEPTTTELKPIAVPFFNFDKHEHPVRIFGTPDEPCFCAADVGVVLEMANIRQNLNHLEPDEKGVILTYTLGGEQEINIITESGLYALAFRSRKPQAKAFRKWITGEVIPSLRRTGSYTLPGAAPAGLDPAVVAQLVQGQAQSTALLCRLLPLVESMLDRVARLESPHSHSYSLPHHLTSPPSGPAPIRILTDEYAQLAALCLSQFAPAPGLHATLTLQDILTVCDSHGLLQTVLPPSTTADAHGRLTSLGYRLRSQWPSSRFPHPADPATTCRIIPRDGARHATWLILAN